MHTWLSNLRAPVPKKSLETCGVSVGLEATGWVPSLRANKSHVEPRCSLCDPLHSLGYVKIVCTALRLDNRAPISI